MQTFVAQRRNSELLHLLLTFFLSKRLFLYHTDKLFIHNINIFYFTYKWGRQERVETVRIVYNFRSSSLGFLKILENAYFSNSFPFKSQ